MLEKEHRPAEGDLPLSSEHEAELRCVSESLLTILRSVIRDLREQGLIELSAREQCSDFLNGKLREEPDVQT